MVVGRTAPVGAGLLKTNAELRQAGLHDVTDRALTAIFLSRPDLRRLSRQQLLNRFFSVGVSGSRIFSNIPNPKLLARDRSIGGAGVQLFVGLPSATLLPARQRFVVGRGGAEAVRAQKRRKVIAEKRAEQIIRTGVIPPAVAPIGSFQRVQLKSQIKEIQKIRNQIADTQRQVKASAPTDQELSFFQRTSKVRFGDPTKDPRKLARENALNKLIVDVTVGRLRNIPQDLRNQLIEERKLLEQMRSIAELNRLVKKFAGLSQADFNEELLKQKAKIQAERLKGRVIFGTILTPIEIELKQVELTKQFRALQIEEQRLARTSGRIRTVRELRVFSEMIRNFTTRLINFELKQKKLSVQIAKFNKFQVKTILGKQITPRKIRVITPGKKEPTGFVGTRAGAVPVSATKRTKFETDIVKSFQNESRAIQNALFDSGSNFVNIGIGTGNFIGNTIPISTKIRLNALLRRIESIPAPQTRGLKALLSPIRTKQVSKSQVENTLRQLGGSTVQLGSIFAPGGIGIASRLSAIGASRNPTDTAIALMLGAGFGVGAVALGKTSRIVKLFIGNSKLGKVFVVATRVTGRGLIPAFFLIQGTRSLIPLFQSLGNEGKIRQITSSIASEFAGFIVGAKLGGAVTQRFLAPVEGRITTAVEAKKFSKAKQKKFKEFIEISKEIGGIKSKVDNPRLDVAERISPKVARVIERFLKTTKVVLSGSIAQFFQVPLRVRRTLPKPSDVDLSGTQKGWIKEGRKLFQMLKNAGVERVSKIEKLKGASPTIKITINGKKAIEIFPRSRLIQNIREVRGLFELSSQSIVTSPKGIRMLKLSTQVKRKIIGGFFGGKLRAKDLTQFEKITGVLTQKQIKKARLRAGKKGTREQAFSGLLPRLPRLNLGEKGTVGKGVDSKTLRKLGIKRIKSTRYYSRILRRTKLGQIRYAYARIRPNKIQIKRIVIYNGLTPVQRTRLGLPSRITIGRVVYPKLSIVRGKIAIPTNKKLPILITSSYPVVPVSKVPKKIISKKITPPGLEKPKRPTTPPEIKKPKEKLFPLPSLSFIGQVNFLRKSKLAFNVFVRTKILGKRKFRRMNKKPLTGVSALALGEKITDNSPLRSFFVGRTKGKPVKLKIKPFDIRRYRKPKGKTKLPLFAFVERVAFTIDKPGELRGITAKGIASRKRKKLSNKKTKTNNPRKKVKQKRFSTFDFARFAPRSRKQKRINKKQIKKTVKRKAPRKKKKGFFDI